MLAQQEDGAGVLKAPSDEILTSNSVSARKNSGNGGTSFISSNGGTPAPVDQHQAQRCPRCDSLNTKFCYYNNYSLSQPRHFCKSCRRYWTKGGTLRNVPVGGGCRKNKRLKHRDANCLVSLAEMQDAPSTSCLLSSISVCTGPFHRPAGFGPSTSSLISELAREGHGYEEAFSGSYESLRSPRNVPNNSIQDFSSVGSHSSVFSTGPLNGPSFLVDLIYRNSDPPPAMFHHLHELPAFYGHQNLGQSLPQTADHHVSASSLETEPPFPVGTSTMDRSKVSLMQQMQLPTREAHEETRNHINTNQQAGIELKQVKDEMSLLTSEHKSSVCWQNRPSAASARDEAFFAPGSQAGASNVESSLWNVSWPEMHAVLAGSTSTATGAMLH